MKKGIVTIFALLSIVVIPRVSFGAVTMSAQSVTVPTSYPANTQFNYTVTATGADIGRSFYVGSMTTSDSVEVFDPSFCHTLSATPTAYTDNILLPPAPYADFFYYKFNGGVCTGTTTAPPTNFYTTTWTVPYPAIGLSDSESLSSVCETVGVTETCIYAGHTPVLIEFLVMFLLFTCSATLAFAVLKKLMLR